MPDNSPQESLDHLSENGVSQSLPMSMPEGFIHSITEIEVIWTLFSQGTSLLAAQNGPSQISRPNVLNNAETEHEGWNCTWSRPNV